MSGLRPTTFRESFGCGFLTLLGIIFALYLLGKLFGTGQ